MAYFEGERIKYFHLSQSTQQKVNREFQKYFRYSLVLSITDSVFEKCILSKNYDLSVPIAPQGKTAQLISSQAEKILNVNDFFVDHLN
eukprot:TRINITY_DN11630_c0_g1_i1.p1 TRINITY_DN11630_c0_g1~~TRINITY_DN11630_c0_g1_i1.p1  ORF type:complete len:88 (+),score=14.38 TRINITY_DN11630_c0_g1_i1:19-282(+)